MDFGDERTVFRLQTGCVGKNADAGLSVSFGIRNQVFGCVDIEQVEEVLENGNPVCGRHREKVVAVLQEQLSVGQDGARREHIVEELLEFGVDFGGDFGEFDGALAECVS